VAVARGLQKSFLVRIFLVRPQGQKQALRALEVARAAVISAGIAKVSLWKNLSVGEQEGIMMASQSSE